MLKYLMYGMIRYSSYYIYEISKNVLQNITTMSEDAIHCQHNLFISNSNMLRSLVFKKP